MNKVIDKGFRSCRFVSTIVKHPVQPLHLHLHTFRNIWVNSNSFNHIWVIETASYKLGYN